MIYLDNVLNLIRKELYLVEIFRNVKEIKISGN